MVASRTKRDVLNLATNVRIFNVTLSNVVSIYDQRFKEGVLERYKSVIYWYNIQSLDAERQMLDTDIHEIW